MVLERTREKIKDPSARLERLGTEMFGCSVENYRSLKSRIEMNDGNVTILVHPFYEYEHSAQPPQDEMRKAQLEKVTKSLEELIAGIPEYRAPLIILQESKHMPRRDIHLMGDPRQNIFFVPTRDSDPRPSFTYTSAEKTGPESKMGNWREVLDVLKDLGVKKIELGGMYLWGSFGGCVGYARSAFSSEFSIHLSEMTYPDSKKPWNNDKVS